MRLSAQINICLKRTKWREERTDTQHNLQTHKQTPKRTMDVELYWIANWPAIAD